MEQSLQPLLSRLGQLSDQFAELRDGVQKAIRIADEDPEMALTRVRKVLEYVVRDVYERRVKEPPGTRPLENLLQRLVKDGFLPPRVNAYATTVRELGNVGTHRFGEGITREDVEQSLAQLARILEWYTEEERPDALGAAAKPRPPMAARPGRAPRYGERAYRLCDRNSQVSSFYRFYLRHSAQSPGRPQFYFVHGEKMESHTSLVKRIVEDEIERIGRSRHGGQTCAPRFKKLWWLDRGELTARREELTGTLFREFAPSDAGEGQTTAALCGHESLRLYSPVVVQHDTDGSLWDTTARRLVEWYMDYWAEVKAGHAGPQFLIFLCLIYPKARAARPWRFWPSAKGFDKGRVAADLKQLEAARGDRCPRLVLSELVTPGPREVEDWFEEVGIGDELTRVKLSEKICAGGAPLSMAHIEEELRAIHKRFGENERGLT